MKNKLIVVFFTFVAAAMIITGYGFNLLQNLLN
jgi:hypothetical protein